MLLILVGVLLFSGSVIVKAQPPKSGGYPLLQRSIKLLQSYKFWKSYPQIALSDLYIVASQEDLARICEQGDLSKDDCTRVAVSDAFIMNGKLPIYLIKGSEWEAWNQRYATFPDFQSPYAILMAGVLLHETAHASGVYNECDAFSLQSDYYVKYLPFTAERDALSYAEMIKEIKEEQCAGHLPAK